MSPKILILSALCAVLFSTHFPAAVSQLLPNTGYVGCYKDAKDRAFEHGSGYVNDIDQCIINCKTKKYQYAGLETYLGKIECWCGNKFDKYGKSNSCNKPCNTGGGMCGGKWALSVYKTPEFLHLPNRGYVGCYKDAKDRAFEHGSGYVNNIDHCIYNCQKKKYQYAGLETYLGKIECWCGNKFDKYGKSNSCNRPCNNRGGVCGGKWALSVYKADVLRISVVSQHLPNRGYVGCYKDAKNRAFSHGSGYVNNIDDCIGNCERKKYQYAGLQSNNRRIECWCGNEFDKYGKSNSCNSPCNNNGGMCGGLWANSVYTTRAILYLPNRGYVGCYKDAKDRAFEHGSGYVNYIDHCIHMCKTKKYKYAGIQTLRGHIECWCGNKYDKYGKSYSCARPCNNRGGMCGGPWALSVYRTDVLNLSGKGEGYLKYKGYVGCFNDHIYRDLPEDKGDVHHIDQCIEKCQSGKFLYAGIQAQRECYCGDNVGLYGKSDSCNRDCRMKGGKCGGEWANSVYRTNANRYGGYVGCFHDKKDRDLTVDGGTFVHSYLSGCILRCRRKGYKYAGLQFHKECRCGNHYGRYGKAERCDTPCGSGPGMCGGVWKNSVYRVG